MNLLKVILDSRSEFAHPELSYEKSGKVRDLWQITGRDGWFILFMTDRISTYDVVHPNGIPNKGRLLTRISQKWFEFFKDILNHLVDIKDAGLSPSLTDHLLSFADRIMVCRRYPRPDIECVVRQYIAGSGWKDYKKSSGLVCGIQLRPGLRQYDQLDEPIFTPATKATEGHDENINFARMKLIMAEFLQQTDVTTQGEGIALATDRLAELFRQTSLNIYSAARDFAARKGIIIADTKFEFGIDDQGQLVIIDELLSPDSSRFWPYAEWHEGQEPTSFDKQYVRNYVSELGWDKTPPAPQLPEDVVMKTQERYQEIVYKLFPEH
ncbi:phosphoribosylaminoimidazolesuccinocarboxamide synthase [Patescibacteria group bacterium]